MSDLKDNVIMPSSDYKSICDAVRAKTGSTELLKSGELAEAINGIGEKSSIVDMSRFCGNGYRVNELNKIDTSKSTSFYGTFINCDGYTSFPDIDTSSGTDFRDMFHNCQSLASSPNLDTSNGTLFGNMFYNCFKLTSVSGINTSNGTDFGSMFYYCESLTSIPEMNTSKGMRFSNMFYYCKNLTEIPEMDTSSGTQFSNMFLACSSLVSIPSLDLNSATESSSVDRMFVSCGNLRNLYLHNIRASITLSNNTSYGTLLTVDSIVNTIKELCTVTTPQTLTIGDTNLAKIADLYCRVTDNTTEKKPMEICESTAEGAMTLSAYAALKNWQIA